MTSDANFNSAASPVMLTLAALTVIAVETGIAAGGFILPMLRDTQPDEGTPRRLVREVKTTAFSLKTPTVHAACIKPQRQQGKCRQTPYVDKNYKRYMG